MKKIFTIIGLIMALNIAANSAIAAESMRPIKPSFYHRLSGHWKKVSRYKNTSLLQNIMTASGIQQRVFRSVNSNATIIPPAETIRKTAAPETSSQIRVMSANLLLFPFPFLYTTEDRINEFIRAAREFDPDILFLQEVWDNSSLQILISAFPWHYSVYTANITYNRSGLLILSRYPVSTATNETFIQRLEHNLEELLAQKSILSCTIYFAGHEIALFNTHLYSSVSQQKYYPTPSQFQLFQQRILECKNAVIAGADLNLRPHELKKLTDDKLISDNCTLPTAGFPVPDKKLDYLMIKSAEYLNLKIEGKRLEWPTAFSDHSAVIGLVSLEKSSEN